MTKVTFISTPDDGSCGIGTYTGTLLKNLDTSLDIRHVTVPLGSWNPFSYLAAVLQLKGDHSDVVHVQHEYGIFGPKSLMSWLFFPALYVISNIFGEEVVITFHSAWNDETIGPPLMGLKKIYVRFNNSLLAAVADHAIFLSDNCKERFLQSTSLSSYEVLPHGVQTDTVEIDSATAKETFGYKPEETLIVEPGYVRPEKGYETFLDVARNAPDYEFLIAGGNQNEDDAEYMANISQQAPENVQITGVLNDSEFHAVFNAADLILLPYEEVTQSGIFNWCVAYELPVIASDEQYFRNLNTQWNCVSLFDSGNADAALANVRELLDDEDQRTRLVAALKDYRKSQSIDGVADKHVKTYQQLCDSSAA
ncbi:glycosyltransferase [Halorussus pelagicus]|uniref:glycosyltransferase n=1 Tax=Halorussus pelagicus TaxID=2505977 RepID=UPI000FFC199E|nr:glycosyltransferase [Halorussus pelagicus]